MAQREILDFLERHAGSLSPYIAEARAAVRDGTCDAGFSPSSVKCAELLETYAARAEHLRYFGTDHAANLHREVTAFCAALQPASEHSARFFHVTLRSGRTFMFFEDADTSELLGALASYDARALSDVERRRVWGIRNPEPLR